jgi:fructose-1,6-bisphosphatase/inositol monophosphatase family enzyme
VDTDAVLALLQEVAEEVVDPRFRNLEREQVTSKGRPGDLVTVVDREAEERITAVLQPAHPDALVLGEEAVHADPGLRDRFAHAEHAFTVDPVDGTRQFVKGSPDHAMMVAELRGGEVVRSWIWQPQHRRAYLAELGAGAWRDGTRLERQPATATAGLAGRRTWAGRVAGAVRGLRYTSTCCGIDYARIADGSDQGADYGVWFRTKPWDHAPGSLLVQEAGGWVGTASGEPYRPQGPAPRRIVAAADRATYDLVRGFVPGA